MQEVFLQIISHPFEDIEVFLSLWGAFGVLVFFWGLCGFFLSHGHIDHQDHARAYMVWGVVLTGAAILVWEGIRFLTGVITNAPLSPVGIFFGIADIIIIIAVLWISLTAKPKGH